MMNCRAGSGGTGGPQACQTLAMPVYSPTSSCRGHSGTKGYRALPPVPDGIVRGQERGWFWGELSRVKIRSGWRRSEQARGLGLSLEGAGRFWRASATLSRLEKVEGQPWAPCGRWMPGLLTPHQQAESSTQPTTEGDLEGHYPSSLLTAAWLWLSRSPGSAVLGGDGSANTSRFPPHIVHVPGSPT